MWVLIFITFFPGRTVFLIIGFAGRYPIHTVADLCANQVLRCVPLCDVMWLKKHGLYLEATTSSTNVNIYDVKYVCY